MRVTLLCLMAFVSAVNWGCTRKKSDIITTFGTYEVSSQLTLTVIDDGGIVRLILKDYGKVKVDSADIRPSAYQKWVAYVSKDGALWFDSSDIGLYAWLPEKSGYRLVTFRIGSPLPAQIPKPLFEQLPSSHKRLILEAHAQKKK